MYPVEKSPPVRPAGHRRAGTMQALEVEEVSGPDGLRLVERAEPERAGAAIIEVRAAGVGFVDTLLARGRYQIRPDPPFVPGLEIAGLLRSAPPESGLARGQRVIAHVMLGGFAQTALAKPELVAPLPDALSFVEGAGMVVNYHTAHFALTRRARLAPGDTVLVHGAGGGLGTACVQMACALGGRVLAVASSQGRRELAALAGAEAVFGPEEWFDAVRAGGRADVIIDPIGGERFEQSVRCLAPEGRIVTVGFTSGQIPHAAANRLLLSNAGVLGAAWREFLEYDPSLFARTAQAIAGLIDGGLRPLVGATYPLADGAQALRHLESREACGKLVLDVS